MQDFVIIPTYDRPEMLWLCLEHLTHTPQAPSSSILQCRIYVDAHIGQPPPPKAEIEAVIEKFPRLSFQMVYRTPHPYHGNSYNVLMAFKDAAEMDVEYVYLLEDDVIVDTDFFSWHHVVHLDQKLGCSIAVQDPEHGGYASLGVCFKRKTLQLIAPHCRPAYFQNMRSYCRQHFPPSPFDCEQDGLWSRVLQGHRILWAPVPYAQHVGWYGYHRRKSIRPFGSLEQRYLQVKLALSSTAHLRAWERDFGDIQPLIKSCN